MNNSPQSEWSQLTTHTSSQSVCNVGVLKEISTAAQKRDVWRRLLSTKRRWSEHEHLQKTPVVYSTTTGLKKDMAITKDRYIRLLEEN